MEKKCYTNATKYKWEKDTELDRDYNLELDFCRQEMKMDFVLLFFFPVFQLFAKVDSLLLFLELELLLLGGLEGCDRESRLLLLRRHFGESRTDFGNFLQLRLHEFSLDVVELDRQLVDVRVLLNETVFEVDRVDHHLPDLLVQLDASVLQGSRIETIDIKGSHFL